MMVGRDRQKSTDRVSPSLTIAHGKMEEGKTEIKNQKKRKDAEAQSLMGDDDDLPQAKPLPEGDEPSPEKAFDGNRGKEMSAIVEAVLSGSVVRLLCTDTMRYVTMPLAGVQAPSSGKKANGEDSQPLAREARFFTECRALHRDVMATFVGYSPGPLAQQALCSVKLHGADGMTIDLAEDILASGYGRFVDTTAAVLPRGGKLLLLLVLSCIQVVPGCRVMFETILLLGGVPQKARS